jgi:predicted transcriptional regulator
MTDENIQLNAVELATELTIAWLSNSNTRTSADEVPAFLARMHSSVQSLMSGAEGTDAPAAGAQDYSPAVSTRKSLANPDFIVSMVDGKSYKTLRRHNLKDDYPMVAPTYSEARRAMAHRIGLGSVRKGDGTSPKAPAKSKKPKAVPSE